MNWEAIGASGEVLGGVLVIATLVYLSIQLKQTNTIAFYNAQKDLFSRYNEINRIIATDPALIEVLLKTEELSPKEERQMYAVAMMYGALWLSAEDGLNNGQIWEETYRTIAGDVSTQIELSPGLIRPLNQWLNNYPDIERKFEIVRSIRAAQ